MKKISVIGNLCTDYYPLHPSSVDRIKSITTKRGIVLDKSPKQIVDCIEEIIEEALETEVFIKRFGGGGYNSLQALVRINDNGIVISYYDLTACPDTKQNSGVRYNYRGLCQVSSALILDSDGERKSIKNERRDKTAELRGSDLEELTNNLNEAEIILANSIGNYEIAEQIGKVGGEKYTVITKNLSEENLGQSNMLANSTAIIDIEEANAVGCSTERTDDNIYIIARKIKELGAKKSVITLGSDGVAFLNSDGEIVVRAVNRQIEAKVQRNIGAYHIPVTGAGDFFAAALAYYSGVKNYNLEAAVIFAQMFVIRNKLRFRDIREFNFERRKILQEAYVR